jgi:hypothetical protein
MPGNARAPKMGWVSLDDENSVEGELQLRIRNAGDVRGWRSIPVTVLVRCDVEPLGALFIRYLVNVE